MLYFPSQIYLIIKIKSLQPKIKPCIVCSWRGDELKWNRWCVSNFQPGNASTTQLAAKTKQNIYNMIFLNRGVTGNSVHLADWFMIEMHFILVNSCGISND